MEKALEFTPVLKRGTIKFFPTFPDVTLEEDACSRRCECNTLLSQDGYRSPDLFSGNICICVCLYLGVLATGSFSWCLSSSLGVDLVSLLWSTKDMTTLDSVPQGPISSACPPIILVVQCHPDLVGLYTNLNFACVLWSWAVLSGQGHDICLLIIILRSWLQKIVFIAISTTQNNHCQGF